MSPIQDLPTRLREYGRIRIGDQADGKPRKLARPRVTCRDEQTAKVIAGLYGGVPRKWESPGPDEWELYVESDELDVVILPQHALSQSLELWKGGGCERRCDGVREELNDRPCLCPRDPEERMTAAARGEACKPTTRLNVVIPEAGFGFFRLETHSFYAAVELRAVIDGLIAVGVSTPIDATLKIEERRIKRPGETTKRFIVPVLDVDRRLLVRALDSARALEQRELEQLSAPAEDRALPAGEPEEPEPVETPRSYVTGEIKKLLDAAFGDDKQARSEWIRSTYRELFGAEYDPAIELELDQLRDLLFAARARAHEASTLFGSAK